MQTVTVTCASGTAHIPALGFGTWQLTGSTCTQAVQTALATGYRHIDTAQIYGNEAEVGQAIKSSNVSRNDLWLTTKVWTDKFSKSTLSPSVEESLRKLQTDHVDLLLLHWPNPSVKLEETLDALMDVQSKGYTTHIGVSNFPLAMWQQATKHCGNKLVTNQVEFHPYLNQQHLVQYAQQTGQSVTAYSPIAQGAVADDALIQQIAQKYNRTPSQVTLRWLIQQPQVIAIPRSKTQSRIQENFDIEGFTLTAEDMQQISNLQSRNHRLVNPGFAPQWDEARAA